MSLVADQLESAEQLTIRDQFCLDMSPEAALEAVEDIAYEWEQSVGNFSDAVMVAKLMPDPIGWFDRQVSCPKVPESIVKEVQDAFREFHLSLPDEYVWCCDEPRSSWAYCPVCGDPLQKISLKSIFSNSEAEVKCARIRARDQVLEFGAKP